jgi:hypothetical protein
MENYDRQQYNGGGDFGEVREDAFVGPSDGQEAVSEDAGQGDYWGGYPDRDIPQEEQQQQEQGYVEGEYDPGSEYDTGFVPEGEYTPGSDYDRGFVPESGDDPEGGYDPLFTWGGFEDDVVLRSRWRRPQPSLGLVRSPSRRWGGRTPTPETPKSRCTQRMLGRLASRPESTRTTSRCSPETAKSRCSHDLRADRRPG